MRDDVGVKTGGIEYKDQGKDPYGSGSLKAGPVVSPSGQGFFSLASAQVTWLDREQVERLVTQLQAWLANSPPAPAKWRPI